ncbi:cytoskeleton protein RodZ [Zobellella endophytica]|uniref:Cytoskeleton protein RodZ n=1 Tax=Zobellella endophytica TaxID=2116700 RepID=A0A2P7QQI3_9GAMM|nr:cytoskeleton protein RodZ [Zobellella endophytica]PSJ40200.1 cytoskeleton protein RodZ [Zobellella endophytica]
MTINEAEQQPQAESRVVAGPGAMLRQAREARGWTQAEVARRLNLRLAVIESIDHDEYKAGVAVTFLRGYVKAYAKVVGVDEQTALSAFDGMSGIEQMSTAAPMQSFSKKTRQQASDKWLKRISWLVLLGLLGSLFYWWWQDSGASYIERTLEPVAQQAEPEPSSEPVAPQATGGNPAAVDALSQPLALPPITEPEPMPADTGIPANPEGGETSPNLATGSAPVAESEPVAEPVATAEPAAVDASAVPAGGEDEPAAAEADPRQLVMRFSDDCWIQVTDSQGRVMAEGVKKADESLTLEGEPPFRLVLGAPRAASVEYMNQAVDLSSFNAGRVARLTVPQP